MKTLIAFAFSLFCFNSVKTQAQSFCENPEAYIKVIGKKVSANPNTNEIFEFVETPPTFQDGLAGIYRFIESKTTLPTSKTKIAVQLTIEKNGKISAVNSDNNDLLTTKIKEILSTMPNWQAAAFGKTKVRSRLKLYLYFPLTS